jgi:Ca2+-transporting ATPase
VLKAVLAAAELRGMSAQAAADRLRAEGPNELPRPDRRGFWRIVFGVLREPMFALLLAGGAVYFAIGEAKDALVLMVFATVSVAIAVIQELRSERVLESLRSLSSPTALVIRDGQRLRIPARELVRDDIVVVAEGDRAPADCIVLEANQVEADESLLTGESVPVSKTAASHGEGLVRPGTESSASLYAGALVVRGQATVRVAATGSRTEIGRIGGALQTIVQPPTHLTLETRSIVRWMGLVALLVCASVVLVFGLVRHEWLQGLLGGVALGMAMIPEEFPLVLTVFMVMGAWRIAGAGVLTRKAAAIETLGSATVLCTDKTGTLTQNRMTVVCGWRDGAVLELEADGESITDLARVGAWASSAHPFDPMERALQMAAGDKGLIGPNWALQRAYGLRPGLMAVTHVWASTGDPVRYIAAKGAPEAIADLCRLGDGQRAAVLAAVKALAERGMRVLGLAEGRFEGIDLPDSPTELTVGFIGLVGLADPLRPDVPDAVRACREAGIRVVMITGDYPVTARAIADQAGLAGGALLTGAELAAMTDVDLMKCIGATVIFARILPEQKLQIVRALKAAGEVVAMTGDGVNDAPALKAADIGIAMGERGADVAREAASLVLLKDGFGAIVQTIRLGRRIYDNLRHTMNFILAVHVPIAGMALIPLLTGGNLVFAPVHIAFLEMFIDPVCSVAFEAEPDHPGLMRRPPRRAGAKLFSPSRVILALIQGAMALAAVMAVYRFGLWRMSDPAVARSDAFAALVLTDVALVFASRAADTGLRSSLMLPNPSLWIMISFTMALLAAALFTRIGEVLFQFGRPDPMGLAAAVVAGMAVLSAALAADRISRMIWLTRSRTVSAVRPV